MVHGIGTGMLCTTFCWCPIQVMPLLRHILENATDRPHALLRAKALECISLVGMAVGRARFREDAARVMQLMQALQAGPCAQRQSGAGFGGVSLKTPAVATFAGCSGPYAFCTHAAL